MFTAQITYTHTHVKKKKKRRFRTKKGLFSLSSSFFNVKSVYLYIGGALDNNLLSRAPQFLISTGNAAHY